MPAPNESPSGETNGHGVVRFGIFEADLRAGELRRSGSKVRLQEQPFQILALLLEKSGQVVTREELRARLWPADTFVDFDHSLNAAIKRLRDALGDTADNPRFVETLARRGYRFVAPVHGANGHSAPAIIEPALSQHSLLARWRGQIAVAVSVLLIVGLGVGWFAGRRSTPAPPPQPVERRLTANPVEVPVRSAVLSSDGRLLAYTDRTGLYLKALASGEVHPVPLPPDFFPVVTSWFPDGTHLLVLSQVESKSRASLWNLSVLGGAPRKILDDCEEAAVSPDGSQIAFLRGDYATQSVWVAQTDGTKSRRLVSRPEAAYASVTWSPDGTHLAFLEQKYRHGFWAFDASLGIYDLAQNHLQHVLSDSRLTTGIAWTSDGRLIYTLSEPPPNQQDSNLWAWRLDSRTGRPIGQATRLTAGPDWKTQLSASTDGHKLVFQRTTAAPDIYVAEIPASASRLGPLQLLTLDERKDLPFGWTPDSKAVLFTSDRDGPFHVFKQSLDQRTADLLVGGPESALMARLNAEGTGILYSLSPPVDDSSGRVRIMEMPLAGGESRLVLADSNIGNFQCARAPATICVMAQSFTDKLVLSAFDPATGARREIKSINDSEWYLNNWTLSPDGSTLALSKKLRAQNPATIRFIPTNGGAEHTVTIQNWSAISSIDWDAQGRGLWASVSSPPAHALIHISPQGKTSLAFEESQKDLGWAIPSPDGKHLAIWEASRTSNVWLLEGF